MIDISKHASMRPNSRVKRTMQRTHNERPLGTTLKINQSKLNEKSIVLWNIYDFNFEELGR